MSVLKPDKQHVRCLQVVKNREKNMTVQSSRQVFNGGTEISHRQITAHFNNLNSTV